MSVSKTNFFYVYVDSLMTKNLILLVSRPISEKNEIFCL
ncbi:MAG: hypothetical protein RL015_1458 [Verrucomicrobiota bacterium]|jgi:hypothetical protein